MSNLNINGSAVRSTTPEYDGQSVHNVSMFPGGDGPSLLINATACSGNDNPPCPAPSFGTQLPGNRPSGVSGPLTNATFYGGDYAFLMNITGSGSQTLETFQFSQSNNSDTYSLKGTGSYIADNFTVNYPGGSKYSWTQDVGVVSAFPNDSRL